MTAIMRANWTTSRVLLVMVLLVAVAGLSSISLFLGGSYALEGLTVRHVTPDRLASAMQGDAFFSAYRENTLVVRGTVASATNAGRTVTLEFTTKGRFKALCQMHPGSPKIRAGDTITIVSEALTAQRRPSAVLLTGCVLAVSG